MISSVSAREQRVDVREGSKETLHESSSMPNIIRTRHLAAAVHGELRNADINGAETEPRRENGADRRPAAAVLSDDEILEGHAGKLGDAAHQKCRRRVRRVPLVAVILDY